jgi:hypothetical protein
MVVSATEIIFRGFTTNGVLSQLSEPQTVTVGFSEGGGAIPWTVTAQAGIALHTPSSGVGPGTITLNLSGLNGFVNNGLFPSQGIEYLLTVSAPAAAPGTQSQTIRVVIALTEGQASSFTATPSVLTLPADGGRRDLAIRSTVATAPWRVSSSATWLSFHRIEGRGDGFVEVTAAANASSAARTAIIVAAGRTITVTQAGMGAVVPGPPTGFVASTAGLQLSGLWTAPSTGGVPTGYVVEASATPDFTGAILLSFTQTSFSLQAPESVAGQTFYLRVRGVNASGAGAPSHVQTVTFAGGVPGPPPSFTVGAVGLQLTGAWTPPSTGGVPTSYLVEVSTTGGFASVLTSFVVPTGTSFTVTAPAEVAGQTFYLRVRGVNASGAGAPSPVQAVTFGGSV